MDKHQRDEWRQADRLFQRMIGLNETERRQMLADISIAGSVLDKLESLLGASQRPHRLLDGDKLELPWLGGFASDDAESQDGVEGGRCIGDWRLHELIGRGGMAAVYRGERVGHDYTQQAAVKLLGVALAGQLAQTRFRREQRILAQLQHPHIASLIDAGVADDGTPYLAMALVDGERIDTWCDQHGLGIRDRVRLMLQVCAAVAYAHRQLVIHRDIKPGNILVDDSGHATLLDFGIARLLDADSTNEATITQAFTPDYAAPEQRDRHQILGTPVDIYGLGAVLHRLLTGAAPQSDVHGDPLPASRTARERGNVKSAAELRGDLDAILGLALDPDPSRRYSSVDALRDDLDAWLKHRTVQACSATVWKRLGKLVRRNRVATALTVLAIVAVASTITSIILNHAEVERRVSQLQQVSRFQADMLEQIDPQKLGLLLKKNVASALAKSSNSGKAVSDAALTKVDFTGIGVTVLNRALLDHALNTVRTKFAAQPQVRAMLLQSLANIYRGLFEFDKARQVQSEATALFRSTLGVGDPQTLASMRNHLKLVNLSYPPNGEKQIRKVLALHERYLGPNSVDTALVRASLGSWLIVADPARAEVLLRNALANIARSHGHDSPDAINVKGNLAVAVASQDRFEEAAQLFSAVIKDSRRVLGADNSETLEMMNDLAWTQGRLGHEEQAHALYKHLFDIDKRVFGEFAPRTLRVLNNVAALPRRRGDYATAEPMQRKAWRGMLSALGPDHPETLRLQTNLAEICLHLGKLDEAQSLLDDSLRGWKLKDDKLALAQVERLLGQTWQAMGDNQQAEQALLASWQDASSIHRRQEQGRTAQALADFYAQSSNSKSQQAHWLERAHELEKPQTGPPPDK